MGALPKGKLDDGETPRTAAEREVLEETGYDVLVHEFLGTLVYESGGRSKVVHYWRMEAPGEQIHELMDDVRAVAWLPLEAAVERLSRGYERAFLANVGPLAVEALTVVEPARRKAPAPRKRRSRRVTTPPSVGIPIATPSIPIASPPAPIVQEHLLVTSDPSEAESLPPAHEMDLEITPPSQVTPAAAPVESEYIGAPDKIETVQGGRRSLVDKVRDWLWHAVPT